MVKILKYFLNFKNKKTLCNINNMIVMKEIKNDLSLGVKQADDLAWLKTVFIPSTMNKQIHAGG